MDDAAQDAPRSRRLAAALLTATAVAAALVPAQPGDAASSPPLTLELPAHLVYDHAAQHADDHEHGSAALPSGAGVGDADATPDAPSDHSFLSRSDPPARWDPCDYIDWRATLSGAPRDGFNDMVEAVRKVEAATGLRFRYLGESTHVPTTARRTAADADLSFAWADAAASDLLGGSGAAGIGGGSWRSGSVDAGGRPVMRITQGFALLEAGHARGLDAWIDDTIAKHGSVDPRQVAALVDEVERGRKQVALHELGHAVGLGHALGSAQVMAPTASGVVEWGAGDRAGLTALGAAGGCLAPTQAEAQAGAVPAALEGPPLRPSSVVLPGLAPVAPTAAPAPAGGPVLDPAPAPAPAGPAPTATVPAAVPPAAVPAPTAARPSPTAAPVRVSVSGPTRVRRGATVALTVRGRPGDAFTVHMRRAGARSFVTARSGRLDRAGRATVTFRPTVDHRWFARVGPARTATSTGLTRVAR